MRRRTKQSRSLTLPLALGSLALGVAFDVARRAYRNSQLFCPSPDPVKSWDPRDYGIPARAVEEHWMETPDDERLYAWYCRSRHPIASLLFCHGNTGNITVSADIIPHLLDAGVNVLIFDYRGFGKSTGRASITGVVEDSLTAAQFHDSIRPAALPSILYGYSLGGAVAGQVITRHPFDALILQSTFTSLTAITRTLYRRVPMHLLAGKLFDTLATVKRLDVPLLVLHGGSDEVVPCSMAHELFDACPAQKQIHVVAGGLHKDLYIRDCDSLVWAVNQFVMELRQPALRAQSL
ncbi:MAG TPA: alpha/beta fold hydrolase [Thermoanaerobaculia bacterium]|nr:alpha/beta fold hydrolase [Thermoanaerobaculia bacterium]